MFGDESGSGLGLVFFDRVSAQLIELDVSFNWWEKGEMETEIKY